MDRTFRNVSKQFEHVCEQILSYDNKAPIRWLNLNRQYAEKIQLAKKGERRASLYYYEEFKA